MKLTEDAKRKQKRGGLREELKSREKNKQLKHLSFFFNVFEMIPWEGFMPKQLSSASLFSPTFCFNMQRN